jgi:hypothetical protein
MAQTMGCFSGDKALEQTKKVFRHLSLSLSLWWRARLVGTFSAEGIVENLQIMQIYSETGPMSTVNAALQFIVLYIILYKHRINRDITQQIWMTKMKKMKPGINI